MIRKGRTAATESGLLLYLALQQASIVSVTSFLSLSPQLSSYPLVAGFTCPTSRGAPAASPLCLEQCRSNTAKRPKTIRRRHNLLQLRAHYLTSALESLGREKGVFFNEDDDDEDWLLPSLLNIANNSNGDDEGLLSVPLYTLPTVYLPTGGKGGETPEGDNVMITYTLQNIEPRNIQMALDLAQLDTKENSDSSSSSSTATTSSSTSWPASGSSSTDKRFCVTLRTIDTGRLANVGTLMRVMDMEFIKQDDGNGDESDDNDHVNVKKIILTCVAEDTVDIVRVENPHASDLAHRLRHPNEYLRAKVRPRSATANGKETFPDDGKMEQLAKKIQEDFNRVRECLLEGFGADDLPRFARDNLAESLPPLEDHQCLLMTKDDSSSSSSAPRGFWETAYQWQTLAYTLREGYQQRLASDRNELLIAGAMKQGGPLNLPVHLEDLWPEDRQGVVELEQRLQEEWAATGLEPVLEFQALIRATCHMDRLELLAKMVARERERLTMIALLPRPVEGIEKADENVVRKGAWFDNY